MTEVEAFLQAIVENPDDDGPRLIFADWLEERGDPRAEFIRVQCALADTRPDNSRRAELKQRERALLRQHQEQWIQPLRGLITGWLFRRGFVEMIWVRGPRFLKYAGTLFEQAPICEVGLLEAWGLAPELAVSPYLARLSALALSSNNIGDDDVQALAKSPYLSRLASLDLGSNPISSRGAEQLAASPHLAELLSLRLSFNQLRDDGAEALARTQTLVRLEPLNLHGNGIGDRGALALARSTRLTRLDRLYLGGQKFSDAASAALRARFGKRLVL
jgi:uncharacterized protein (TIGR02996 family)